MKKFLLLTALISGLQLHAQVPQKVVVEHFTNTYCSTCASRNPGFYSNVNQHPDVLHLSYHPSSPYPQCPLNQHNKAENDERTQHYGIYGSTPRLVVQGNVISAGANYNSSALFDPYEGKTSSIDLQAKLMYSPGNYQLQLSIKRVAAGGLDSASLFAALYEDTVFMTNANGEVNPKNVFRQSFASSTGFPSGTFALPTQVGDSLLFYLSLSANSAWRDGHIFAAALLQNPANKAIEQASATASADLVLTIPDQPKTKVVLYPNPYTSGDLRLEGLTSDSPYRVYSLDGKLQDQGTVKAGIIPVANLPKGLYLLVIGESKLKLQVQ